MVEACKISENSAADCAPCADSDFTLKEQILMPDNMELAEGNNSETTPTNKKELLA
jgi:hypothetical protein